MQISSHMFPVELKAETDAIFLPFTTSWSWATWQRAWKHFDPEMSGYEILRKDRRLRHQFDLNGAYSYFTMLEAQRNGQIDSWAIRWYLSVFTQKGLTLYPVQSLVGNTGFDGSGTHCGIQDVLAIDFSNRIQQKAASFPAISKVNLEAHRIISQHLRNQQGSRRDLSNILKEILQITQFKN